ncbi:branched-chain amino acid transport system ATP-binding protein [Spinactinospora alkalitolerans]|uniref:Branched-chain amino acid transport system ATP-binding protein n=1 Tax=Spinactinospora alkalitolerans TaxID=687207 RepID=A0A852TV38_9ACTN|nr:ABC transporter ATP-binding protein [Spinactinospora alkalitolerans]NYE47265.1 branched-chain amino acid transport system ATP-binding protein [Spinactinospora alkalitolerans]
MTTTTLAPLLRAEGVTVRFGGLLALGDVGLAVPPGTVVGLIGPNGAGKTTLFNVLSGVVRPQQGRVVWKGRPLRGHRPHHLAGLGIARTLQGLNLFPGLSVLDNVIVGADRLAGGGMPAMLTGLGGYQRDERRLRDKAMAVLEDFGVADAAHAMPQTLPYGVQKRAALARAVVAEPELLMLDEPASGLSGADITELGDRIRAFGRRMGVLLVEHHMDLVMGICDHIVVLNFGEVIASGSPAVIRADPAVAQAYLGASVREGSDD